MAYLASKDCPLTGKVLAVQGGAVSLPQGWRAKDVVETGGPWLLEKLPAQLDHWAAG